MTHPGLVMLVLGVGIGAMLYYFFASPPEGQTPYSNRQSRNSNGHDLNRTHRSRPRNFRNRKPDTKCTICMDEDNSEKVVRLDPCKHVFHEMCIKQWRESGVEDTRLLCPVCRRETKYFDELR